MTNSLFNYESAYIELTDIIRAAIKAFPFTKVKAVEVERGLFFEELLTPDNFEVGQSALLISFNLQGNADGRRLNSNKGLFSYGSVTSEASLRIYDRNRRDRYQIIQSLFDYQDWKGWIFLSSLESAEELNDMYFPYLELRISKIQHVGQ